MEFFESQPGKAEGKCESMSSIEDYTEDQFGLDVWFAGQNCLSEGLSF
jgi:hypothetical protein